MRPAPLAGRFSSLPGLLVALAACDGPGACEEDVRAQVIEERVALVVGGQPVEAELADDANERDRGWKHRACDREALLLVPDEPGPLPIWGCALTGPVDLGFVRDGVIVEVVEGLAPCPEPCGGCPLVGEGLEVEAVLEVPAGSLALDADATVEGL